jgi:hypothetical protein
VKRLVPILATLSLAFAGAASAPAAAPQAQPTTAPVIALKTCSGRYVHAIVGGEHKCLGSGQFCATRYQRIYRRYGFVCKPGSDGRLRLHRR